jgi:hypothetical protein
MSTIYIILYYVILCAHATMLCFRSSKIIPIGWTCHSDVLLLHSLRIGLLLIYNLDSLFDIYFFFSVDLSMIHTPHSIPPPAVCQPLTPPLSWHVNEDCDERVPAWEFYLRAVMFHVCLWMCDVVSGAGAVAMTVHVVAWRGMAWRGVKNMVD